MNNAGRGSTSKYSITALPVRVNVLKNNEFIFLQLVRMPL